MSIVWVFDISSISTATSWWLIEDGQVPLTDFGLSGMGVGQKWGGTFPPWTQEYYAPEVDKGCTLEPSADIFSLGAVFLEMLIPFICPDGLIDLKEILKSPRDEKHSYAKNIDNVHKWMGQMEKKVHPGGWEIFVLSTCRDMLNSNPKARPSAKNLCSILPKLSVLGGLVLTVKSIRFG